MKKALIMVFVVALLLLQIVAVSALTAGEAKQEWLDSKQASQDAQADHREAKVTYAGEPTPENEQGVINTGKVSLHTALDEVEAWLNWKVLEAEENPEVPEDIKDSISADVDTNLEKIDALRIEVDGVDSRFELGIVFLRMIGQYFELLADVARNSGMMWTHIGETKADTIAEYEAELREQAEDIADNEAIMEKLDTALSELEIARRNIVNAEDTYALVKLPGTPLLKFAEGNNYLKAARANLLNAHGQLNQAYRLMVTR